MTPDSTAALTATGMHGLVAAHPRSAHSVNSPSALFRAWHQLAHEWRFQRGLVLLDWLLLAAACWDTLREKSMPAALPSHLPAALALVIIVRSVRADSPGNAEAMSHTRPLGRGAVWAGKTAFFILALLLPWLLHAMPQYTSYQFGTSEWLALALQHLIPAALLGTLAAALVSLASSRRQNILMTLAAFALAIGLGVVLAKSGGDVRRCGISIAGVVLLLTVFSAWWWQSVRLRFRAAWLCLLVGLALAFTIPCVWSWNWRALPPLQYTASKLSLHIGTPPEGPSQELWSRLHLRGLPPDHVASVIAFAPGPESGAKWPLPNIITSDYTDVDTTTGEHSQPWRWMTDDHTAALTPHYPPRTLWHGNTTDYPRDPTLAEALKYQLKTDPRAAEKPWRLRLAIHRMHRVFHQPMPALMGRSHSIPLQPGHRLDFHLKEIDNQDNGGELQFAATLRRRFPLLLPEGPYAKVKPMGELPMQNFIAVLHSPALHEVRVSHEDSRQFNYHHTLLLARHDRSASFDFPHPSPYMEIAGLTLESWVTDSTLDIWWPEERGTIDLEISPAELQQALEPK